MSERRRLPNRRASEQFAFECNGLRYVATVSFFPDAELAEIFINNAKAGSTSDSAAKDFRRRGFDRPAARRTGFRYPWRLAARCPRRRKLAPWCGARHLGRGQRMTERKTFDDIAQNIAEVIDDAVSTVPRSRERRITLIRHSVRRALVLGYKAARNRAVATLAAQGSSP